MKRLIPAAGLICLLIPSVQARDEPSPMEMLEALNLAVAYIQYCEIDVPLETAMRAASAGQTLEASLGISREMADARFEVLKEVVIADPPDCDPNSEDMAPVLNSMGMLP